jgi:hypothetical protein
VDRLLYWFITRTQMTKASAMLGAVAFIIWVCLLGPCLFIASLSDSGDEAALQITGTAETTTLSTEVSPPTDRPTSMLTNTPAPAAHPTATPAHAPTLAPTQTPTSSPGSAGADRVVAFNPGPGVNAAYSDPEALLGDPDLVENPCCEGVVQLGKGGSVLLAFVDNTIVDGDGPDFQVFGESARDDYLLIEVSADGQTWQAYPTVSESPGGLDLVDVGLEGVVFVRLTDVQPATATGAEVDAVVALHSGPGLEGDLPSLPDAVARRDLVLREGPDEQTQMTGEASSGTSLTVLGRSETGRWLKVQTGTGESGWCRLSDLALNVSVGSYAPVQALPTSADTSLLTTAARIPPGPRPTAAPHPTSRRQTWIVAA